MRKLYFKLITFLLIFTLLSCSSNKILNGTFRNNISPYGLTSYEISFKKNNICSFKHRTHMQGTIELNGKYIINGKKVYIRFLEPDKVDEENSITDILTWTANDEFNSYKLKKEKGIEYHYKYLIKNDKLYVYRVDNGKLVKRVKHYNDKRGRHKTNYYLQRMTQKRTND